MKIHDEYCYYCIAQLTPFIKGWVLFEFATKGTSENSSVIQLLLLFFNITGWAGLGFFIN
jgi:hypothetical protein